MTYAAKRKYYVSICSYENKSKVSKTDSIFCQTIHVFVYYANSSFVGVYLSCLSFIFLSKKHQSLLYWSKVSVCLTFSDKQWSLSIRSSFWLLLLNHCNMMELCEATLSTDYAEGYVKVKYNIKMFKLKTCPSNWHFKRNHYHINMIRIR